MKYKILAILSLYLTITNAPAMDTKDYTSQAEIHWGKYIDKEQSFDHAMINLPISLNGKMYTAQLDTGANYDFRLATNIPEAGGLIDTEISLDKLKKSIKLSKKSLEYIKNNQGIRIGVIGNAFFESGTIVLNFENNTILFHDGAALKDNLNAEKFSYFHPDRWDGGYIIINAIIKDKLLPMVLDTGAALFSLVPFENTLWNEYIKDSKITVIDKCQLTSINIEITIGKQQFTNGIIGKCPEAPEILSKNFYGILGMNFFENGILTIDYRSKKWLFSKSD